MSSVIIIGAGAAGNVVARKCAQHRSIFKHVHLASRTLAKCVAIQQACTTPIEVSQLDADDSQEVYKLLTKVKADLVINMALPYQDLSIMNACIKARVHYVDTANYEPRDEAKFCYKWQWDLDQACKDAGITALLGSGFDPGVTNLFCAYAQKHYFDQIDTIDIVDCNDGSHSHPFATNFNPEINIREITQRGKYWENGAWRETEPLSQSQSIIFPEVGSRKAYLLYHEELESLVKHIPGLQRIRFWMTFSTSYLTYLKVLTSLGLTSIKPVEFQGQKIVPLEFLKHLLPSPASLAENYSGKTSIGCIIQGKKNHLPKSVFTYNVCDHAQCYRELGAQAVSYTTGVPAFIGALMLLTGKWQGKGVFNIEQFDPDPFMAALNAHGLPWQVEEADSAKAWLEC